VIAERADTQGKRGRGTAVVSKTTELAVRRRRPRARHDVGVEPLDWVRIGVVLTVVLLASGGGLATAGMLRQGPLADIGSTDRTLEGFKVENWTPRAETLEVGVHVPASRCVLEVTVDVVETPQQVMVGPVHTREPRLPFTAPDCAGGVPRQRNGRVYATAQLSRELGTRSVVDARNQREVEVVAPRNG
jgi:hypothetical protein